MCTVPKPFPKEFREDVVRVARNRDPGQSLKQAGPPAGVRDRRQRMLGHGGYGI
jgi:hypothetical protein